MHDIPYTRSDVTYTVNIRTNSDQLILSTTLLFSQTANCSCFHVLACLLTERRGMDTLKSPTIISQPVPGMQRHNNNICVNAQCPTTHFTMTTPSRTSSSRTERIQATIIIMHMHSPCHSATQHSFLLCAHAMLA